MVFNFLKNKRILIALVALIFACLAIFMWIDEWTINHPFEKVACHISKKELVKNKNLLFKPRFYVEYHLHGIEYQGWADLNVLTLSSSDQAQETKKLRRYRVGEQYECWYQSTHPETIVLEKISGILPWIMASLALFFMLILLFIVNKKLRFSISFGFFKTFFFLGSVFFIIGLIIFQQQWYVNHAYKEAQCTIVDKQLKCEGTATDKKNCVYEPRFYVQYMINNHRYTQWIFAKAEHFSSSIKPLMDLTLSKYDIGQTYPCWYDPYDEESIVLKQSFSRVANIFFIIAFILMSIGVYDSVMKRRKKL